MDVYVRTIKTATEVLVAACDADIVGQTFEENELYLEVKPDFYCGDAVSLEECDAFFNEATILNLVGQNVVERAVRLGLVNPGNILKIGGTVHAQMVRL
ncbi:MAG: DUF424 family protein [Theionarchaea archaeon]|nr:DUF424 family protein [Theionarchaea archaeon]